MNYYISFDAGTQSTTVAIYDEKFDCVIKKSYPTSISFPQSGWAEMDANKYLNDVVTGIRECVEESDIDPENVRAICGDGIIMGIVGVDEDLNPITPYTPYLDSRATEEVEYVKTLDPIWIEESGNSVVEPLQPPMMAMWMIKNNEEFKKNGAKILNNGPFILANLAGLKAEDAFIDYATLGGWILGYDAKKKEWSSKQMEMFGIDEKYLPEIVEPTDIVGGLSKEFADKTGLPEGIPIVAGAGDTMQSFVGAGVYEVGTASDVAGTAAMFGIMVDDIHEELSRDSGLYFSIASVPDTYFYWGYIRTGGLSLQWFKDKVMGMADDDSFYERVNTAAQEINPGSNGTLFFPYLQGGQAFITDASGCFLNMDSNSNTGELWRSILESIAYEYRNLVDIIRDAGVEVNEAVITEGGSRSDVWNQIKADVLDINTKTMKNKEGASLTNAVYAAKAVGDIESIKEILDKKLQSDKYFEKIPQNVDYYKQSYNYYSDILNNHMRETFNQCRGLRDVKCPDGNC